MSLIKPLKKAYAYFILPALFFVVCTFNIFSQEYGASVYQGASFLQTRPVLMRLSLNNHLWIDYIYQKKGSMGGGFSMTPFFLKTRKKSEAQSYFLPNHKNTVLIAGDTNDEKILLKRDVRAEWLGLPSDTQSLYGVCPSYQQSGFTLAYNQDVKKIVSFDWFSHWQIGIRVPFILVEYTLESKEQNIENGERFAVINAFKNSTWQAQRVTDYQRSVGIGDISVYIDSPYFVKDFFIFAAHSGCTIPTAPRASSAYLFSPTRGNDRRFSLFGGVDIQIRLNQDFHIWQTAFFISVESYYHFNTHARRTLDIKGKPWSRFLLFNRSDDAVHTNIPGVNVLTFNVHLRPQTYGEVSFGWRFCSKIWHIEFGYNIWGRAGERIKYIDDELLPVFGIAGSRPLTSANGSTIKDKASDDARFVAIKLDDLDLLSGCSSSALNHGAHIAIGASKAGDKIDAFMGCGLCVEQGHTVGALPQWGGWFKIGFTV